MLMDAVLDAQTLREKLKPGFAAVALIYIYILFPPPSTVSWFASQLVLESC